MRTGRPKRPLTLEPADKEKLELLARRPKTAQRVALRSKIVLRAAEGLSNQEIARRLGVTGATVGKWRERYRVQGMKGLSDDSRPGAPRGITAAKVYIGSRYFTFRIRSPRQNLVKYYKTVDPHPVFKPSRDHRERNFPSVTEPRPSGSRLLRICVLTTETNT